MHIVLLGDSIFDNAGFLGEDDSIEEILRETIPDAYVSLLAVDGSGMSDINRQLHLIAEKPSCVFVSCGSSESTTTDDRIHSGSNQKLFAQNNSKSARMSERKAIRNTFRAGFASVLDKVKAKCENVAVLGVYKNSDPENIGSAKSFGMVNEIIMEESSRRLIPVINLGALLTDPEDFSTVFPIRPSFNGGTKIANRLKVVIDSDFAYGIY